MAPQASSTRDSTLGCLVVRSDDLPGGSFASDPEARILTTSVIWDWYRSNAIGWRVGFISNKRRLFVYLFFRVKFQENYGRNDSIVNT
jgi:hypothetical protein